MPATLRYRTGFRGTLRTDMMTSDEAPRGSRPGRIAGEFVVTQLRHRLQSII